MKKASIISPFSLKFKNPQFENAYEEIRMKNFLDNFRRVFLVFFIHTLIFLIFRILLQTGRSLLAEILKTIAIPLLYIIISLLQRTKNYEKPIAMLIQCLTLFYIIFEIEAVAPRITEKENNYYTGFQVSTYQIIFCFHHLSWVDLWGTASILQLYILFRTGISYSDFQLIHAHNMLWTLSSLIFLTIIFYRHEKNKRLSYYELVKGKDQLQFFHDLIKENIPNPIIIAKKEKSEEDCVEFANAACTRMLGTYNKKKISEKLRCFSFRSLEGAAGSPRKRVSKIELDKSKSNLSFWSLLQNQNFPDDSNEQTFFDFQAKLDLGLKSFNNENIVYIPTQPKTGSFKEKFNSPRGLWQNRMLHKREPEDEVDFENIGMNQDMPELISKKSLEMSSSSGEEGLIESPPLTRNKGRDPTSISEKMYFSVKCGQISWEDSPAMLFIFTEVTDSVMRANFKAEQILSTNKDKLLASFSHQLRTPLNAIISSLDHLKPYSFKEKNVNKMVKICWRSAQLLFYSIGNLLDLSKINTKSLILDMTTIRLRTLIEEVINLVKFKAKLKSLNLQVITEVPKDLSITCDRERLKQILINLLDNSIKYTNFGGSISFKITPYFPDSSRHSSLKFLSSIPWEENESSYSVELENNVKKIRISIEDSGIGIEEDKFANLFTLFSREQITSEQSEGVGLGLALSQRILKKMLPKSLRKEGLIKVKSTIGVGSKFSFLLPVNAASYQKKDQISKKVPRSLSLTSIKLPSFSHREVEAPRNILIQGVKLNLERIRNLYVLIVDDDQINQLVVKNYLLKLGITAYEMANNGKEAVEQVTKAFEKGKPFDLILMDLNMPIMDGYEATKRIGEIIKAGNLPQIKIVAITANVASNDRERCTVAGMDSYLTKPINKLLFRETLEKQLGLKFEGTF